MTDFTSPFGGNPIAPSEYTYAAYALTVDQVFFWPSQYNGVDGLLVADILEVSANAANLTFTLPLADAVSPGQDILIRNTGGNTFDVVNAANGAVSTIDPGDVKYLYVKDNTTQAGVWGVFSFGVGTGQADASQLAGLGLRATGGTLEVLFSYLNANANYNILTSDRGKLIDITAGSITLTLPQASTAGDGFYVLIHNSGNGSAVIEGFGTETVDGSLNKTLFPQESALFICNGTFWRSVGYGRDATFIFSEFVVNAGGGSVVLTSADVAGRMIRVAGVAAGNITITLPSVDNIYFVNVEAGMGGFSVTFTTGSGGTVILQASQKTCLYCDGTNITPAITTSVTSTISLDDGSAAAPSLSFSLDTDLGLFRAGANILGITAGGVEVARFSSVGLVALDDHITDPTDAHDASAISYLGSAGISATDVEGALDELDTEKAPLASPVFTGNPTAPTPAVGDDDTSIATTAFVMDAFADGFGGGSLGFKNLVINGAMEVAQRGKSFVAIADNTFVVDRWLYQKIGTMVHTATQQTDTPAIGQLRVTDSVVLTLTTADNAIAAGDLCALQHRIEGYLLRKIAQQAFTMSFLVRATLPGVYCVSFRNSVNDRSYVAEFTINAPDTYERKTITVPASPSAGTWDYTNGIGLRVTFALAVGTNFHTTPNAWQVGNFLATANQVNGVDTGANDFRITQVQIELGDEATPFEVRPFGTELALCQRYYEKSFPQAVVPANNTTFAGSHSSVQVSASSTQQNSLGPTVFKVTKRATPTVTIFNPGSGTAGQPVGDVGSWSGTAVGNQGEAAFKILATSPGGSVAGQTVSYNWTADAEL